MRFIYGVLSIYISIVNICSCTIRNNFSESGTDSLLNKIVQFPDDLFELRGTEFFAIDPYLKEINGKKKVVSIVDASCMKCIVNELNKVDSAFSEIYKGSSVEKIFILNVNSIDSGYFMRNIRPNITSSATLFWDRNYYFENVNSLFTGHVYLRTYLLDESNKIILYGNPIMNPKLHDKYKKIL